MKKLNTIKEINETSLLKETVKWNDIVTYEITDKLYDELSSISYDIENQISIISFLNERKNEIKLKENELFVVLFDTPIENVDSTIIMYEHTLLNIVEMNDFKNELIETVNDNFEFLISTK